MPPLGVAPSRNASPNPDRIRSAGVGFPPSLRPPVRWGANGAGGSPLSRKADGLSPVLLRQGSGLPPAVDARSGNVRPGHADRPGRRGGNRIRGTVPAPARTGKNRAVSPAVTVACMLCRTPARDPQRRAPAAGARGWCGWVIRWPRRTPFRATGLAPPTPLIPQGSTARVRCGGRLLPHRSGEVPHGDRAAGLDEGSRQSAATRRPFGAPEPRCSLADRTVTATGTTLPSPWDSTPADPGPQASLASIAPEVPGTGPGRLARGHRHRETYISMPPMAPLPAGACRALSGMSATRASVTSTINAMEAAF